MIEVQQLRKQYGDLVAVEDVSFEAAAGEIFGLLGPNGAGKSTTIGCISGLLTPTSGQVRVMGHDVVRDGKKAKRTLGIVPQELALYEDLSATDNLRFWGAAYGLKGAHLEARVRDVLDGVGLADRGKEAVKGYSGGMKRRLNFACGIVHEPKVLLLDEPTVGVDPQSRVRLLELVRMQAEAGTCVLYTTHYMEEAQELCDRLAIVDNGEIKAKGSLDELRALIGDRDLVRLTGSFSEQACRTALAGLDRSEVVSVEDSSLIVALEGASRRLPELFAALSEAGADVHETSVRRPNLEA
ncbi:MAG: ABC-2 type transport system ATP-binding protein, partial [Planctomycetota bacterium]